MLGLLRSTSAADETEKTALTDAFSAVSRKILADGDFSLTTVSGIREIMANSAEPGLRLGAVKLLADIALAEPRLLTSIQTLFAEQARLPEKKMDIYSAIGDAQRSLNKQAMDDLRRVTAALKCPPPS
jgi:hypothetical protein